MVFLRAIIIAMSIVFVLYWGITITSAIGNLYGMVKHSIIK